MLSSQYNFLRSLNLPAFKDIILCFRYHR